MKFIVCVFIAVATNLCTAKEELFRKQLQDAHLVHYIGVSDLREKGTNSLTLSYTITKPGYYLLTETIISETRNGAIVVIASNDVILDLHGNTITQSSDATNVDGIFINNNLTNITIKHGIIRKTTGNGVEVSSGCSNISLEDITVIECNRTGILFNGSAQALIRNSEVKKCLVSATSSTTSDAIGLNLTYCTVFTAIDSAFNTSRTTTNTFNAYGVFAQNNSALTFINCTALANQGETIAAGFCADNSTSVAFEHCTANQNSATDTAVSESYGFLMNNSTAVTFKNCHAAQNNAINTAAGLRIKGSKYNYLFECVAQSNFITGSGANDRAHGFMVDTTGSIGHRFEYCTASGNQGSTNALSLCAGFSLATATHCILANCLSQANGGTAGFGVGINLAADCALCLVKECQVVSNRSLTSGQAIGIRDQHATGTSTLIDNFAFSNRDSSLTPLDRNYLILYNDSKVVQDVQYNNISTITAGTRRSIGVKIAP
ncbi:right-handed parallel beta-helix repeat-containing protein [bacterium]|nr:right-handed parallel beta-helix repeat-containing protein [bacterium]